MPFIKPILLLSLLVFGLSYPVTEELRMNQVQVIASHNSYKQSIEPDLMEMMVAFNPKAKELEYGHLPLSEQLDLGLRGLEIDVLYDPEGGRYTRPKGLDMLRGQGKATQAYDTSELVNPGFKVLHVPDIDFRTHCATFKGCLSTVKKWSSQHPDHLPIFITLNPKNSGVDLPDFTEVLPFNGEVLVALDKEILEIFDATELITPSLVKGQHATLRAAILQTGWPLLSEARGKVLFALDAGYDITNQYLQIDDFSRPMFVNVAKDHPYAGFFIKNNPIDQEQEIEELVKQGFIVRTRSDANTKEAREGDISRFEAAIQSGAQLISTDYYLKSLSPNQDFEIAFPNGAYSQCNPVLIKQADCGL